jgi:3-hydroxyisobutyrate dehydrogenase
MALNLVRSGVPLLVWNRSAERVAPLRGAGARVAEFSDQVFAESDIVILMLANAGAVDTVLHRGTSKFDSLVNGKIIVTMGTTAPEYSEALQTNIRAAGGKYVEAPVSGSRKPAEAAQLVGMLAGEPEVVAIVKPLLGPTCRHQFECGPVPSALRMKLAVNLFLITMVTGLAEAFHFAQAHGLSLQQFREILDEGPMASSVSKMKLEKLVRGDFGVQAAIDDVLMNARLVENAARKARIASPLLDQSVDLYQATSELGRGVEDMAAVVFAIANASTAERSK